MGAPGPIYTAVMSELAVGSVFAGHRLDAVAGRGGMGVVYRATQLSLERTVALKVIAPALMEDSGIRRRFVREAKIAASIDHPNVIPVYYAGEADGIAYIAMRFVAGEDLRSLVRRDGPLPAERAVGIVVQVASALDAAHAAGLVHRDVKPANVLLDAAGNGYLTDFGLTKHVLSLGGATQPGHWVGTLDFVAPEQIRGERVDARADVYALGCLLYFAVCGTVPFAHESQEAKLWAHLNEQPPRVCDAVPGLRPAFDAVIARALAKDPEDRYLSAGDLGLAVAAAAAGEPVAERERMVAVGAAAPVEAETRTAANVMPAGAVTADPATAALPDATRRQSADILAARPPGRRQAPLVVAALLLVGGVAATAVALLGGSRDPGSPGGSTRTATPAGPALPRVVAAVPVGGRPNAIAVAGGRVWVGRFGSPRLLAIDPPRARVIPGLSPEVGIGTVDMALGGGSLWVAVSRERRLVRLDARTGRLIATIPLPKAVAAVAWAGGAPWVAFDIPEDNSRGQIARIDPATGVTVASDSVRDGVVGMREAFGAHWVLCGRSARLIRLDPVTARRERIIRLLGGRAGGLTIGDDAVWVTLRESDQVARVEIPSGNISRVAVGSAPSGVEVREGRVWVANHASSTVTAVDQRTARVRGEPVEVAINPVDMASTGGELWVTTVGDSSVQKIELGN